MPAESAEVTVRRRLWWLGLRLPSRRGDRRRAFLGEGGVWETEMSKLNSRREDDGVGVGSVCACSGGEWEAMMCGAVVCRGREVMGRVRLCVWRFLC